MKTLFTAVFALMATLVLVGCETTGEIFLEDPGYVTYLPERETIYIHPDPPVIFYPSPPRYIQPLPPPRLFIQPNPHHFDGPPPVFNHPSRPHFEATPLPDRPLIRPLPPPRPPPSMTAPLRLGPSHSGSPGPFTNRSPRPGVRNR